MLKFDCVIIGGAMVGSATAYYLKKQGFKGSIALVEKDLSFQKCCSALSLGGLRQQFSTPENIALSQFGLQLIRHIKQEFGPDADVNFREQGYLILAPEQGAAILEENCRIQMANGADNVLMGPQALKARFPFLNTQDVALGCFGQTGEGWLDAYSLMTLFRKAAIAQGVTLINAAVNGLAQNGTRITEVHLDNGEVLACGEVVNAAGPAAGAITAMAGLSLPVAPRKRYVFVLDCPKASDALRAGPLTVDISGTYYRPEGRNFLCGNSPDEQDEPPVNWEMDHSWFEERLWPNLAERVPAFEELKVINAWVGHYDYNDFDQNGIFGRHPKLANFIFANGFSGHGMQQGPATGCLTAELITQGAYRSIDVKRLDYSRIARGETMFEHNVI